MISKKFPAIMEQKNLGGAFAWALGEDGDDFTHLKTLNDEMKKFEKHYPREKSIFGSKVKAGARIQDEL